MKDKIKKMFNRDAWVGWVIVVMLAWFIYMSIDPWMNNRDEFIRIMVMVLGGGVGSSVVIMLLLEKGLPDQETDTYQQYIDEEFSEQEDAEDKTK